MDPKELDKLIRDYLSGRNFPEGEQLFKAWYENHDDKNSPLDGLSQAEKEKVRQEIFAKVRMSNPVQPQKSSKPALLFSRKAARQRYRLAAVWSGFLLLSVAGFLYLRSQDETTTIQTAFGEIRTETLPDGSKVILNAHSTLRYATDWSETRDRQVWLAGEAFFSVVHTPDDRRFQVHTSHLNVEVLGTEFNARSRGEDTEVVLHTGKVKLAFHTEDTTSDVVMSPGELLAYSETRQQITRKVVDPRRYSAWRHHEMILNNTSLAEIARALEDYYGFDVVIQDDQLKQMNLTATAQLSLKDKDIILRAISEIYGIKVTQDGNKILFGYP